MYKITPYVKHIFKDLNCNKLFIFTKIVKDFDNMCQNLKKNADCDKCTFFDLFLLSKPIISCFL